MPIKPSARSHVLLPLQLNLPYSVTMYWELQRVSVTMEPRGSVGRMRDFFVPSFVVNVDERQMNVRPPGES